MTVLRKRGLFFGLNIGLLLSLCLVAGCGDSVKPIEQKNLTGSWNIIDAKRNHKPTKSLDSGYITFEENKQIFSNILASDQDWTYDLVENTIQISGKEDIKLHVINHRTDTIELAGAMGYFYIEMTLARDK